MLSNKISLEIPLEKTDWSGAAEARAKRLEVAEERGSRRETESWGQARARLETWEASFPLFLRSDSLITGGNGSPTL